MTKNRSRLATLGFSTLLLVGCGGAAMRPASSLDTYPAAGVAQVEFLRPSTVLGAYDTDVFVVDEGADRVIGTLSSKQRTRVDLAPGKHRFLVLGGFGGAAMEADLAAGRRYLVVINPIWGASSFKLVPLRRDAEPQWSLANPDITKWRMNCKSVQLAKLPEGEMEELLANARAKKHTYLADLDGRLAKGDRTFLLQPGDSY